MAGLFQPGAQGDVGLHIPRVPIVKIATFKRDHLLTIHRARRNFRFLHPAAHICLAFGVEVSPERPALEIPQHDVHGRQRQQPLSRYDIELAAGTANLRVITRPRLYETPHALPQPRLFGLEETRWLKALKLRGYAPRNPRRPLSLQDVLFPYGEAWF